MAFGFNGDRSKADIASLVTELIAEPISTAIEALRASLTELINGKANTSHTHNASDINSGTLNVARIPNLAASKVNSGTFDIARIPNLSASKVTSGTFARARIESTDWTYMYGSASSTNFSRWRMVAGIVFVEINYASSAGVSTSEASFGTIPSGYRPSKQVTAGGYLATNNNNISCMWVTTGGEVKVIAAASSSSFYGSLSYPLG